MREANLLKVLSRHENIVKFYGVFKHNNILYLGTEFVSGGDLRTYVEKIKPPVIEIIKMARQAAAGMWYLSNHSFIHRDLAARNLLVGMYGPIIVIKVADFGLSRKIEGSSYSTTTTEIPFKWTAPECIKELKFTIQGDVWSFGVVLWEMFEFGIEPYWDIGNSCQKILKFLIAGNRMKIPSNVPQAVGDLMTKCWNENPSNRPSFEIIHQCLVQLEDK